MKSEMFEELWKNGQLALTRMKAEGVNPRPSHGRTRKCVQRVMRELELPEHIEWGGVMRLPVDMIERDGDQQTVTALTRNIGRTEGFDPVTLLRSMKKLIEQYTEPTTLFVYMPPIPMPIDSSEMRGWTMRYAARAGLGWRLVEQPA